MATCQGPAGKISAQAQQTYQSTDGSFLVQFDLFNVDGKTNKTGTFVMEVHPSWAPFAVARYLVLCFSIHCGNNGRVVCTECIAQPISGSS